MPRVYFSPPHLSGEELEFVRDAFASNWIAPAGPHVDAFEREMADVIGARHAVALSSGTAALHLALIGAGVGAGDEVIVSTLTFAASVNPIRYLNATPIFIDSETTSWNMDMDLLEDALAQRARLGRAPKAVVLVHLYGQSADLTRAVEICDRYGVALIEDAAEALGATYNGRQPGVFGRAGVFSFNGNKIITTSGGGMLVSDDGDLITHARKLASQAREPAIHYEHAEVGYNYRLSNILAALGRGQLRVLPQRVEARRANFVRYQQGLGDLPGLTFQPEATWGTSNRWATCMCIDPSAFGADREHIREALEAENIESRPVWKPMHQQPAFHGAPVVGGAVADTLFDRGLCLPSGSNLTVSDVDRVVTIVRGQCAPAG